MKSIARAVLRDAPTSALDLRMESGLPGRPARLMAGRTVFIVANRLSAIRNVDRIHFLEDEAMAEQGSHDTLMEARGRSYALFIRQFSAGELERTAA